MMTRALILAAPRSGSGKTTLTLGILRALKRRGIAVRAAKSGPDYIDPAFHQAACGAASFNLDSWAMPPALIRSLVSQAAADTELLLIESAMGLFDGADGPPGRSGERDGSGAAGSGAAGGGAGGPAGPCRRPRRRASRGAGGRAVRWRYWHVDNYPISGSLVY